MMKRRNKNLNNEKTTLYIPINVKTRMEFFEGFGVKELIKTIVATVICAAVSLVLYAVGAIGMVALIVILLSSVAGGVIFTAKDRNNLSVYDQIVFMVKFSKAVKKYPYKYLDEWR
jgi:hypothetical protein